MLGGASLALKSDEFQDKLNRTLMAKSSTAVIVTGSLSESGGSI